ncbi:hypothetical protein C4B68_38965 [Streptomyces dengpaensis]|uniref:Uncharacterized protein n=1 Tax=Streptomyces dengpaensis TaxID=2049881 RepID=A0ABN5IEM1_9ACTN|nr:hypothetical protein C4B68_38965 [Streptomyces dengpaensis]
MNRPGLYPKEGRPGPFQHLAEVFAAVTFAAGIKGPPHPRHNRGPASSSAITTSPIRGTPSLPTEATLRVGV